MPECRKHRHPTELDAMIALAAVQAKDSGQIRYYRCPLCRGWHLTSKPGPKIHVPKED